METDQMKLTCLYTLNENREVVPCEDPTEWGKWFCSNDRLVAVTDITQEIVVSTVFIGIDPTYLGKDKPAVFETMIFGGPHDLNKVTSCTWQEAQETHNWIVRKSKAAYGVI